MSFKKDNVFTKVPPEPTQNKLGQLPREKIEEYFDKGFVVVKDFFTKEELDPCLEAIEKLVDDLANKLYNAGKIKDLCEDLGVYQRLTAIEKQYTGANIILHKTNNLPKPIQCLWSNPRLLNIIEQLIGPDIAGHPVWNLRTKTPMSEAGVVPWHQDNAYFGDEALDTLIPTAWVPFLDCYPEHGCLQFLPGGHKSGILADHNCCAGGTWYVELVEGEVQRKLGVDDKKDVITTPLDYGDFVLFNNMIPHRSLDNVSNNVRWAMDLRYQDPNKSYGFFGLKEGVVMRSSKDPDMKIDWDTFNAQDRNKKQMEDCKQGILSEGFKEEDLETIISGPWMKRWPIVHHNRHTALLAEKNQ